MSGASHFANAQGTIMGPHADFRIVHGDAITNNHSYQCTHTDDRVVEVYGKTYRRIIDGDIIYRRHLSTQVISVTVRPESEGGTSTSPEPRAVMVRKTTQTAEVVGIGGLFTVTKYEPVRKSDDDGGFELVLGCVLKAATSLRSPYLSQLFAFSGSNLSTLIAHDELADGWGYVIELFEKSRIAYYYFMYTNMAAIESLRYDETVMFRVTDRPRDWSVNLKTLSWHYNPASAAIDPPSENFFIPSLTHFPPLRQDTLRQLDPNEIVACVEETLGDVLCLVASLEWRWISNLSSWAKHGFLTFGSVVDGNKAGILAHFPSPPPLEWVCKSLHPDVKASFSSSVPWRVDLSFRKTGDVQVTLDFGLRISGQHYSQLRAAYLCQSLPFNGCEVVRDVAYIDQVGFTLTTTFHHDPTTSSTPLYLFVPPLRAKIINNMRCIPYPFPRPLFYWSYDPQGKDVIAEENWEELGIPRLELKDWVGSCWNGWDYNFVEDHLRLKNYDWDGRDYAREHGYPELIYGDPYDARLAGVQVQELDPWRQPTESLSTIYEDDAESATDLIECEPPDVEEFGSQYEFETLNDATVLRSTRLSGWSRLTEKIRAASNRKEARKRPLEN
ncbi:hypothetical protein PM082_004639 [Marasmius tenuissimus]|nr:hypothetical protein PM082_004639 [Marasmius tenuissimus]